jgi:anthranilate/para-aminobenzoate synthase component I
MGNPQRADTDAAARVSVHTVRCAVPPADPLSAHLALTARFGREHAYLLESGKDQKSRYTFNGFGLLLTVSVTRGIVRIAGVTALRDLVAAVLRPLLDTTGQEPRLRDPCDLWPVLRTLQGTFDAAGSASEFSFGFLGFFGYDAARYIEDLPYLIDQEPDLPDVQLALYQGCLMTSVQTGKADLLIYESSFWPRLDPDELITLLTEASKAAPVVPAVTMPEAHVIDDTECEQYIANVTLCKKHIAMGDIYQVQIGHELAIYSSAEPTDVYRRLRARNASPYMYLTALDEHLVLGTSPELFLLVEHGDIIMRPIAGTAPRSSRPAAEIARELRKNPKEIAEHTMLLDLCRNDIGRICQQDTLTVPEALYVEYYSHVLHLVSSVSGHVESGKDSFDIIAALFPAGTMTGAPKIRAMEIIEQVEHSRRGLYAGALGLIDIGGYVNMALCIRTLVYRDGCYRTRASAGIVADSVPEREWAETLAKANATHWAVTGRELL